MSSYRVLCVGDSLTEGYYGFGCFHPYTLRLQALLEESDKSAGARIEVANYGVSGETAQAIGFRLKEELLPMLKKSNWVPNVAVLLMGTNDLGRGDSAEYGDVIFERTKACHELLREQGIPTITLLIPTHGMEWLRQFPSLRQIRVVANDKLREYDPNCIDLPALLPHYDDFEFQEDEIGQRGFAEWWDDHLHFNPTGYDKLGELVFAAIDKKMSDERE